MKPLCCDNGPDRGAAAANDRAKTANLHSYSLISIRFVSLLNKHVRNATLLLVILKKMSGRYRCKSVFWVVIITVLDLRRRATCYFCNHSRRMVQYNNCSAFNVSVDVFFVLFLNVCLMCMMWIKVCLVTWSFQICLRKLLGSHTCGSFSPHCVGTLSGDSLWTPRL